MKIVTEKDADLLKTYKENILVIASEQTKLKNQLRNYLRIEKSLQANQQKYDGQKQEQLFLLAKIEKDRQFHVEALKEWRAAAQKLEDQMRRYGEKESLFSEVNRVSFYERQGKLKPPVARQIAQKYGMVFDSKFDTKIFHKGVFFAAPVGDKVAALYHGKVIHAGWVNGFGELLIVDHGDHYYSLYAHNSQIIKKVGEDVNPGEVIALTGDTGSLRGPGLYLEIRHFSESLDPLPWLDLKLLSRL